MAEKCKYKHPIIRDGVSRYDRINEHLQPEQLNLMNLDQKDWLLFAQKLATKLHFFDLKRPDQISGDWLNFWPEEEEIDSFLTQANENDGVEPHHSLYLVFLRLLEHSKLHFNELSKKHLEFYYRRVLQMSEKSFKADKVHILFELAKRVDNQHLPKNTLLSAGKDAKGNDLFFATDEDFVVNRGEINHLRSIYYHEGKGLFYAPIANSLDGLGASLSEDNSMWPGFGSSTMPIARLGFALSSKELHLKEGKRVVRIDFKFTSSLSNKTKSLFLKHFSVFLTGEKEWLGPFQITTEHPISDKDQQIIAPPTPSKSMLSCYVFLDEGEEAVVEYLQAIHGESYNTTLPVIRFLLNRMEDEGEETFRQFRELHLESIKLSIEVHGLQDITVENDNASLDPAKPFLSFGPLPTVGSSFYVGSTEIFEKNWNSVLLNIKWKGLPNSFADHYKAYVTEYIRSNGSIRSNEAKKLYTGTDKKDTEDDAYKSHINSNDHHRVRLYYREAGQWKAAGNNEILFSKDPIEINKKAKEKPQQFSLKQTSTIGLQQKNYPLQSNLEQYLKGSTSPKGTFNPKIYKVAKISQAFQLSNWSSFPKKGFLKLQLQQHFFHKSYAGLLALSLTGKDPKLPIPNEPYTPEIESLKLSYSSSITQIFNEGKRSNIEILHDFQKKSLQLFHDHPFGQKEEHLFLKKQDRGFVVPSEIRLVPNHRQGGELLIGLSGLLPQQTISLLFQIAEGSENPLREPLTLENGIQWHILCSDEWKSLEPDYKLKDTTNHFLISGIVRFSIPKEASLSNSILEDGFYWIRARLNAPLDTVCQFIDIKPQAVTATFHNQNNDLQHLQKGLPAGTISKLKDRLATIKKIEQPFSSFGGRAPENPADFYTRVSERLRHKDRAIHIWDYEQLVLEAFPSVYKVKCLSHTNAKEGREWAPGHVSLVIIPKINPDKAFNRLQPRASQQLLTSIESFIQERCSFHIQFDALNPDFEEIRLEFKVRFHKDYDPNFYRGELQESLIQFLSPWAGDLEANIPFGGTIYRSSLISFIETREYVDYLADLILIHKNAEGEVIASGELRKIEASNASAILVSSPSHDISITEAVCP